MTCYTKSARKLSGSNVISIKYLLFQLNTSLSFMEFKQVLTSRNIVGHIAE